MSMKAYVSMSHGFMAVLLVMICLYCTETRVQAVGQQLDVRQYLKRLNKFVVKSIKSPDGDIIDCVHISHQPAFDHPLLKNHTIQMRPSFHPLGLYDKNKVASEIETSSIPQLWYQNGRCPEETIPIRRMKKDEVLRAERYRRQMQRTIPNPTSLDPNQIINHEHATAFVTRDTYHGTRATINVWNPKVQRPDKYSTSQLWLVGGIGGQVNMIEAGAHVFPSLYGGNNKTRLFTFWTTMDGTSENGCWNLFCRGFVQVNREIALGATFHPISSFNGRQFEVTLYIRMDPKTGNWWLQYGNRSPLGYWPSSLLPHLSGGASLVEWGGEIVNKRQNGQHTSTEMGSGFFAEEGFRRASYIRNIQIVDRSNNLKDPQEISSDVTESSCYDVQVRHANNWGNYLYYGGPGGGPYCK